MASQILLKWAMALFFLRFIRATWQRRVMIAITVSFTIIATIDLFLEIFDCGTPTPQHYLFGQCMSFKTVLGPANYLVAVLMCIIDWLDIFFAILTTHSA